MKKLKKLLHIFLILGWTLVGIGLLQLFNIYDWGQGVIRGKLVFMLFVWILVSLFVFKSKNIFLKPKNTKTKKILEVVFWVCVFIHLVIGIKTAFLVHKTNEIPLDQGQISYRAIQLAKENNNPYSTKVILDPIYYNYLAEGVKDKMYCFEDNEGSLQQRLSSYWKSVDKEKMKALLPDYEKEGCAELKNGFSMAGYRYSPFMFLSYFPFVLLFGKAGIFINHLVVFFILSLFIYKIYKELKINILFFALSYLILFIPSQIRHNVLFNSAGDLLPAFLIIVFVCFQIKKKHFLSGVVAALSISTKFVPGILLVPLLFQKWRASFLGFILTFFSMNIPFFLMDKTGFINNIFLFNFVRPEDQTSLFYFLHPNQELNITLLSLFVLLIIFVIMVIKRLDIKYQVLFLITSMLAVFINSKAFHNNYFVWIIPLISFYIMLVSKKRSEDCQKDSIIKKIK